jgi:hypothetical protein
MVGSCRVCNNSAAQTADEHRDVGVHSPDGAAGVEEARIIGIGVSPRWCRRAGDERAHQVLDLDPHRFDGLLDAHPVKVPGFWCVATAT